MDRVSSTTAVSVTAIPITTVLKTAMVSTAEPPCSMIVETVISPTQTTAVKVAFLAEFDLKDATFSEDHGVCVAILGNRYLNDW